MSERDLILIFIILSAFYWTSIFPPKWILIKQEKAMTQKKLQKGSQYEKFDLDSNGTISDGEMAIAH